MHPKNIFQLRPLALLLGALLLFAGPCQLARAWSAQRANAALVARGIEVEARVVGLLGNQRVRSQSASSSAERCRWEVEWEAERCVETFALPCPAGIEKTPMIYLPSRPTTCRVLNRQAVREDRQPARDMRMATWLIGFALLLLFLARTSFLGRDPQASVKDPD